MVDFRDYFDISYDDEITCDLCNKTWDGKDFGAPDGMYHLMSAHGIESSFESKASEGLDFFEKDNIIDDSPMEEQLYGLFDEEGGDGRNEWPQIRRDFCNGNTDIESLVSGVSNQRSARGIKSILRWADKIFKSNESKANEEIEYTGGDYCGKCGTEFEDKGECKKCDGESKASEYTDEEQKILDHTMEAVRMEGFVMDPNAFTTPHTWVQGSGWGGDDIYCRVCGVSKSIESKRSEYDGSLALDHFSNKWDADNDEQDIIICDHCNVEFDLSEFSSEDAKIHLETVHGIYTTDGNESKASESISDSDKQILGDWVSQNRDWTTIDDLPNEILIPLMAPFGDDTDKRVEAQVEIINYMKSLGESDMVSESWSQKSSINRIEALERIGVKQGDAIKLSSLEFEDFGEDLQGALKGDVEDARREMKSDKDTLDKTDPLEPSYSFQWQQGGEVENPNSEFDQSYPDYNNIGESQTNMTSYECELCDSGFKSNEALSVHHNDKHAISPESFDGYANEGEGLPYAMGDYTDWFSQAWGDDADQSAIPNTVQCEYCFDQFNVEDKQGMISHINSKHDADVDPVNGDTNKSWGESKASEKTGYRKRPTGHGTYVYEEKSKINCQNCDKEIYETDGDTFHTTKCRYCGHVNLTNDLTYEAKASAKENMEAEAMVWYDSLSYSDKIELNITDEAKGYSGQELKDSTFSGNRNIDDAWSNIESYFISKNYDNQGLGDEQDNAAGGSWDGNHMGKSNNTWVGSMMHDNLVTTDPNQAKHGNMGGQLNWTYKGESKASEVSIDDFKRIVDNHQYEKLTFDDGKVLIDAFVASAIVQLYDQLDDAQKQQFDGIVRTSTGVDKLLSIAFKASEGDRKASEFNIGTTMICPICKKEIETGNEDSFYHKSNFYDPNSVPMSYKMQNHFEQEHTPEDFGVQNKNFKGASGGYEAFGDWKTGNQLSLAFRNSFPEYNQDDSTMMNNADKHSTLDSDGNIMPDDYEGESKASEVDQEIITRLEQMREMFEKDIDSSLWDLAHTIFNENKFKNGMTFEEAEKITKDWYFSTTDTGYYKESTDKFEADIENDQVVQKLPDDKRSFDVEAGAEDHGCAECGFTTSDNSEYLDHLNSHEV